MERGDLVGELSLTGGDEAHRDATVDDQAGGLEEAGVVLSRAEVRDRDDQRLARLDAELGARRGTREERWARTRSTSTPCTSTSTESR